MNQAAQHYVGETGRAYHEGKRAIPQIAAPWIARCRAAKIQPSLKPTDTVFEFGAGFGWNLIALKCARKVGYDISGFTETKTGIEWVTDVESLPDGFADIVICHHVLEHVINPPATLATLRRLLRPTGKLLLFVPYEKERRYRRYDPAEPNHHLYAWNPQTLANLVNECGLKPQSATIGRTGYDRASAKLAVKLRAGEFGFRVIRAAARAILPGDEVRLVAVV